MRNKAEEHWRRDRNEKDKAKEHLLALQKKSSKLNEAIGLTIEECDESKRQLSKLQNEVLRVSGLVEKEKKKVGKRAREVAVLKNNLAIVEKERQVLKGELIRQQRVMTSSSVRMKECENERAMVLMEINEQVARHRPS